MSVCALIHQHLVTLEHNVLESLVRRACELLLERLMPRSLLRIFVQSVDQRSLRYGMLFELAVLELLTTVDLEKSRGLRPPKLVYLVVRHIVVTIWRMIELMLERGLNALATISSRVVILAHGLFRASDYEVQVLLMVARLCQQHTFLQLGCTVTVFRR